MSVRTLVIRWEVPEEDGRRLFATLLDAALEAARHRVGPVRLVIDGIWAGWEETETALKQDGWKTDVIRTRMLRVLPARSLSATISTDAADADWIADRIRVAWTEEESPIRFTARAFWLQTATSAPLFEFYVEGFTTFAVFIADLEKLRLFRTIIAELAERNGVAVALEEGD